MKFMQIFARLLIAAAICALPKLALAQGGVTGSIVGYVLDQTGQPLKGVKVVARSDTQIGGGKTTYSDDDGMFRFVGLLPGTFEVTASAARLRTVLQKDIAVGVNSSADISLVMEVESQKVEEVKVIAKAPIVSVTSPSVKEVYDEEFVDALPVESKKWIESLVGNGVPGAVTVNARTTRIRGGGSNQNAFLVDGFNMNGQKVTQKGLAAFEIQTAGAGADGAAYSGGVVNMVTKSGSNKFEMDVTAYVEDSYLRLFKIDALDNTEHGWNNYLMPSFSGPIIKDRLWYFINLETGTLVTTREKDPSGLAAPPRKNSAGNVRGSVKLTWQVTPRNKLQTLFNFNRQFTKNSVGGFGVEQEAQGKGDEMHGMLGLIWESLLTDSLLFRSQIGGQRLINETAPERCRTDPGNCDHIFPITQSYPRAQTLQNYNTHSQNIRKTVELINKFEWFGSSKALGSHNIKLQDTHFVEWSEIVSTVPGDQLIAYNGQTPTSRTEYFSNDPRLEPERYGWFIRSSSSVRNVVTLTDSMRPVAHLTLNPGASWIYGSGANSRGETTISAQALAPSLSAVWDATHDGRTAVRASVSSMVDLDVVALSQHSLGTQVSRRCSWDPASSSFIGDCNYSGGLSGRTIGLPCGDSGFDQYGRDCRTNLKVPRTWEYTVGVEREIVQGVGVGADFVYRQFSNQYETIETNRIWNPGGTELARDGSYRNGRNQSIMDLETPADARRRYIGATGSVHKREGALKLTASYTWSQLTGTVLDGITNEYGDIAGRDVFLRGAYLPDDARHAIRLRGVYDFNAWLKCGVEWRYTSGRPYSRRFYNPDTGGYADYRAQAGINPGADVNDPGDDRPLRLPDTQILGIQLRANLKPLTGINLETYVDALNVLALRTVTSVETQNTPLFQQPTGFQGPLTMRVGMRYRFAR